jgi:hypothetical protein
VGTAALNALALRDLEREGTAMELRTSARLSGRVRRSLTLTVAALSVAVLAPVVAAADTAPTPSSAVPPAAVYETTTQTCGDFGVTVVNRPDAAVADRPADPPPALTVTAPDGSVVVRWQGDVAKGERAASLSCADVDADGRPELLYSTYSGGAHCCYTFALVRMATPTTELLRVDLLDAWSFVPTQLDASPALEFVAADLRLTGLGGLADAVTSPFPRIFAVAGDRYVDATRTYPALLRADRKKALRALTACADRPAADVSACRKGVGLRIVALDILLGTGAAAIAKLPVDAATRAWLASRRADVEAVLATL